MKEENEEEGRRKIGAGERGRGRGINCKEEEYGKDKKEEYGKGKR